MSIGDYVLTGGELPAMVMIDAVSRLVPGVLKNEESAEFESFHDNLLEYPQYTRPEVWQGAEVPEVLLCGIMQKWTVGGWSSRKRGPGSAGLICDELYARKGRASAICRKGSLPYGYA